jgi:hypothetical protein
MIRIRNQILRSKVAKWINICRSVYAGSCVNCCLEFVSQVTEQISLYIARSLLTTPCVQCGKTLSYPCYKSLLDPISKGKFVSATSFRTREKLPTSPLILVDTTLLATWHNWIFLVRLVPGNVAKLLMLHNSLLFALFVYSWRYS